MSKKISVPRGTKDILPDEIQLWQEAEQTIRKILKTYGYKEIRTPIFEETGLFKRSLGQTSDVVTKQLLELAARKESEFSLRPEGTASIVRSYIENSMDRKESLSKLCYMGPMFRGERPQKGRLRQFHQIGVEAIGPNTSSPYLDAEVIALSANMLKVLGINDFEVKINTLGTLDDKANFAEILKSKLKGKKTKLCEDCQDRLSRNVFRILDCKNRECKTIVEFLEFGSDWLCGESRDYFNKVKEALGVLDIPFVEAPYLVRGLDYYTNTVFEITAPSLGSQDALGAGGRYNTLVSDLGGPQVDAVGFALGLERIFLAMPKSEKIADPLLDVFVIALDEKSFTRAFKILNLLREEGVASDICYKISSMKSQMRLADKLGSRYVMIIGEEEMKKSIVTLKDMTKGTQKKINMSDIAKISDELIER